MKENKMYCRYCGKTIKEEDSFCTVCEKPLNGQPSYMYDDGGDSVWFTIDLTQSGEQITGSIQDDELGGGTFSGYIEGNAIEFVKGYDAGGHLPFSYSGTIFLSQKEIRGKWSLKNGTTGAFIIFLN